MNNNVNHHDHTPSGRVREAAELRNEAAVFYTTDPERGAVHTGVTRARHFLPKGCYPTAIMDAHGHITRITTDPLALGDIAQAHSLVVRPARTRLTQILAGVSAEDVAFIDASGSGASFEDVRTLANELTSRGAQVFLFDLAVYAWDGVVRAGGGTSFVCVAEKVATLPATPRRVLVFTDGLGYTPATVPHADWTWVVDAGGADPSQHASGTTTLWVDPRDIDAFTTRDV